MTILGIYLYTYFSKREFYNENSYLKEYSEGQGGLHIYFKIGPSEYQCYAHLYFTPFSQGDVEIIGLSRIRYTIYRNEGIASRDDNNFLPPVSSWVAYKSINRIFQNDNITVIGNALVKFQINETIYNEKFNYVITIIPPLDISGGLYTQKLPMIWAEFGIILGILTSCGFSAGTISKIRREFRYKPDMKEKDEEFFRYLRKRKKQ